MLRTTVQGGQGWDGVGEEVTGSGRKLAGAGNPSDSSLCVGYVSHLCSELGPRGALQARNHG